MEDNTESVKLVHMQKRLEKESRKRENLHYNFSACKRDFKHGHSTDAGGQRLQGISTQKSSEWKSLLVAQVSHVRNYKMQMRMGIHSGDEQFRFHQFTPESRILCRRGRRIQDAAFLSFWRHGETIPPRIVHISFLGSF